LWYSQVIRDEDSQGGQAVAIQELVFRAQDVKRSETKDVWPKILLVSERSSFLSVEVNAAETDDKKAETVGKRRSCVVVVVGPTTKVRARRDPSTFMYACGQSQQVSRENRSGNH
jgi:hypothetical protein